MKDKFLKIWYFAFPFIRNKYIFTLILFVAWISLFDTYHLIDRVKNVTHLKELQQERDFFKGEIERYRRQISELDSDKESLEKFAREYHLMKSPKEDVYIIIDEN